MSKPATAARPRPVAWLLACLYFCTLPGVAPVAMASLAALHGGHPVEIVFDHGHLDVVMHHHASEPHEHEHHHDHSGPSNFGAGTTDHGEHHDHVLHFADSSDACSNRSVAINPVMAVTCMVWQGWSFLSSCAAYTVMQRHAARPPPASPLLLCLRTTVLLV